MAPRTTNTYIDSQGNKIVEPVYNGGGGSVGGMIGIKK